MDLEKLEENISVRITAEDKLKITKKANALYTTPSGLMRQIVMRNLNKY
jgi:hypothetical protein